MVVKEPLCENADFPQKKHFAEPVVRLTFYTGPGILTSFADDVDIPWDDTDW